MAEKRRTHLRYGDTTRGKAAAVRNQRIYDNAPTHRAADHLDAEVERSIVTGLAAAEVTKIPLKDRLKMERDRTGKAFDTKSGPRPIEGDYRATPRRLGASPVNLNRRNELDKATEGYPEGGRVKKAKKSKRKSRR